MDISHTSKAAQGSFVERVERQEPKPKPGTTRNEALMGPLGKLFKRYQESDNSVVQEIMDGIGFTGQLAALRKKYCVGGRNRLQSDDCESACNDAIRACLRVVIPEQYSDLQIKELFKKASNRKMLDACRTVKRRRSLSLEEPINAAGHNSRASIASSAPHTNIELDGGDERLRSVLAIFDDIVPNKDLLTPFIMYQIHGVRYAQIADELGIPLGTVKSRISSAKKEILSHLKTHEHTGNLVRDLLDQGAASNHGFKVSF